MNKLCIQQILLSHLIASVMASAAKRVRVGETSSEQPQEHNYEGDSDTQGISSGEESELDRLLDDEEENMR